MSHLDIYEEWRNARAFLVDDYVCGSFSIPSIEDLADAEDAENEGRSADHAKCVAFYIFGEHGLKREYHVDREMIENGEAYSHGMKVIYCDGKPLTIIPLVEAGLGTRVEA
jgi:hypothetical protein